MKCVVSKWEVKEGNTMTENGLIRINPNKPEFGSLMLISVTAVVSNGFLNKRNKVGFVVGSIDDLQGIIEEFGLKEGIDYSVAVAPHRIVTLEITESEFDNFKSNEAHTEPSESGFREKINPTTEETLATPDGEAIWWKTEVVAEGSDVVDKYVSHVRTAVPATTDGTEEFDADASKEKEKVKAK